MKKYHIKIDEDAFKNIQEATDWYNKRVKGLGTRFQKQVKTQINALKTNSRYAIRYANVRCLLVKKFPFLIHFTLDETNHTVNIFAVIHTSRNPKIWEEKLSSKD